MSIVRIGMAEKKKYGDGYDAIFKKKAGKKPAAAKAAPAAKPAPAKKAAKPAPAKKATAKKK